MYYSKFLISPTKHSLVFKYSNSNLDNRSDYIRRVQIIEILPFPIITDGPKTTVLYEGEMTA